jgi:serine/threonine-protein kinase
MQPPGSAAGAADLSGRNLGGYRLLRRLGSGGMADVYLAEQQSLGRHVAVKVLRPATLRHPAAVDRFMQEARAAAALVHGNIVQIHEVACVDGIHFLAEECVSGPSLKAWFSARGPLDAPQALSVLSQVGSALVKSAQAGIVHRDIKPENLLVTPAGEVKVTDFGLARILEDGATVYHLLAGVPPFTGPTSLAVAMAHQRELLVPLAAHRPELPAGLGRIVDQLLEKKPEDRCESPTELLQAVEAVEAAISTGSRHGRLPLAWEGEAVDWQGASAAPRAATVASAGRTQPQTGRLREASRLLQTAAERERIDRELARRESARRAWLVAAGAAVALAIGFLIGRNRPRRSDLFRTRG